MRPLSPFLYWHIRTFGKGLLLLYVLPLAVLLFATVAQSAVPALRNSTGMLTLGGLAGLWLFFTLPGLSFRMLREGRCYSKNAGMLVGLVFFIIPFGPFGVALLLERFGKQFDVGGLMIATGLSGLIGLFGMLASALVKESQGPTALGVAEYKAGNVGAALAYFLLAAMHSPEERNELRNLAGAFAQAGDYRTALALIEPTLEHAPEEVDNWRAKADLAFYLGDREASMKAFDQALRLDSKNPDIYYDRAVKLSKEEEGHKQALSDYTKALALDNENPKYWANRAALYVRMGRYESALSDASKAHSLDPDDQVAIFQATAACHELGREDERDQWRRKLDSPLMAAMFGAEGGATGKALAHYQRTGDPSKLKATDAGERFLVISPDGVEQLDVDSL